MFGKLLSYSNDGDAYNGDYGLINSSSNGDEVCVISYFVLLGFLYFFGLCTQLDMYKCQQKIV